MLNELENNKLNMCKNFVERAWNSKLNSIKKLKTYDIKLRHLQQFWDVEMISLQTLNCDGLSEYMDKLKRMPLDLDNIVIQKNLPVFDDEKESELLSEYTAADNVIGKHLALIRLQDFYYKYRENDNMYLKKCIEYCNEDIETFTQFINDKTNKMEFYTMPAFKRLSVIFEKANDYEKAIYYCDMEINYCESNNHSHEDADKRKERLIKKQNK